LALLWSLLPQQDARAIKCLMAYYVFLMQIILSASRGCLMFAFVLNVAVMAEFVCTGHLRITNVVPADANNDVSYVCIVNNPFLRSFLQGDDQKVRPNNQTGKQRNLCYQRVPAVSYISQVRGQQ
jgi:hypothetical protein